MSAQQVLFDAPGPKARRNNVIISILAVLALLAVIAWILWRFYDAGQLDPAKWTPFTYTQIQLVILGGIWATLKAAIVATVFALALGVVFSVARLSERRWVSVPALILLEFFRGLPVLLLIFAAFFLGRGSVSPFTAVVIGLSLYNGMVLAEIIRAGILAVPRGQWEAASAIGLRKSATMRLVLIPQAVRSMLPTIIAQIVVLLKDSALGYLVTYRDLLAEVRNIGRDYQNLLPTFIVGAAVYIVINLLVAALARWIEKRGSSKTAGKVGVGSTAD
ncbi:amino acid ABC transporter permease [Saxibacter everestensis]|uniref:Amino acid ABC transporter permease n=1 Tax=Saxibacter everestensis TaxID=2909229 RepID=A0ABY8QVE9_9MICO|nr:amino acid ABC transporter permease [Brevibacteriaceae bacterium ZFBP1038]